MEIIDNATGPWGNIGVGKIVFTDNAAKPKPLESLPDFGTMALALLGVTADLASPDATAPFSDKLSGALGRKVKLAPGESATVNFVIAWHFPNLSLGGWNPAQDTLGGPLDNAGRYYATKFSSALRRRAVCRRPI